MSRRDQLPPEAVRDLLANTRAMDAAARRDGQRGALVTSRDERLAAAKKRS